MSPRTWLAAILPILLLAALVAVILRSGTLEMLGGQAVPPIERLTFQRVELGNEGFVATVLNDGLDEVTIAQVQVDDAYWAFTIEPERTLHHLGKARIVIPYPWVEGETHLIRLVTSTGVTFDHEVAVALPTPRPGSRFLWLFAIVGAYVGVIPVAIGLLWYPVVRRMRRRGLDFLLALTIGLLVFLLVDATADAFEIASVFPESFQGSVLLTFAALAAYLGLEAVGDRLRRQRGRSPAHSAGWVMALIVAVGIGLHNLGEGLAVGAAFALGEVALGGLLIIGFALHNTTEGLAIVAPLARGSNRDEPAPIMALIQLGLIGGLPTILGAWLGAFVYSQVWSLVFLGLGIGAIAQVVGQIVRQMAGEHPITRYLATTPVMLGLLVGFAVMYATGMLLG
jgi:zinc transporter ZupT